MRENAVGVGSAVGKAVGTGVGPFVGADDGVLDGLKIEGAAEGRAVGVFVGVFVGGNVGRFVGTGVGAAVGTVVAVVGSGVGTGVGKIVGTGVGKIVGTVVSSSRRAPSRRPLDRRAFGPLRGGRCCPHANALSSAHRPRRSMLVCPCGPGVRGSVDRQPKQLQALPISACCALACPGLSRACSPWIAGVGRGDVRVVRARLAGHRSGRGEIYFPQDAADDAIVEEPS